jgi:hypothetical protein
MLGVGTIADAARKSAYATMSARPTDGVSMDIQRFALSLARCRGFREA